MKTENKKLENMKKLVLLMLLFAGIANAQIVNIPDANFKAKLLEANTTNFIAQNLSGQFFKIDANNDNEIQVSEAEQVKNLNFPSSNIGSLVGITNFINIEYLICNDNLLTSLDLSGLSNLDNVQCYNNQINSINLTGLTNLTNLACLNNQLTEIDVSMLTNLNTLNCSFNLLTILDVTNVSTLNYLACNGNQLTQLLIKNNSLNNFTTGNLFFSGNPTLLYVCADEEDIDFVQNRVQNYGYTNCEINTYCTFMPGGNYNTITGNIKYDLNNNGCDVTDLNVSNIRINMTQWGINNATFSNNLGNYTFYTTFADQSVALNVENPTWFNLNPATTTISFPDNNNNTTIQDFCISANGIHNDVEVVIEPVTPARPGFDAVYKLIYKNKGNQITSGTITYTFNDAILDYVSASITPTTINYSELTWSYSDLNPFENRSIEISLNVNSQMESPAVNIGDVLYNNVLINSISNDENISDNAFSYNQTVVGSYDPNSIECLEGENVSAEEIGNYLHYAINFENTGNYQAENVVVKTDIDPTKYDINSLQLLNSSHEVDARITDNKVEFIFKNINLAATAGNPPVGGHGNVLFKIRSKSDLVSGDSVSRMANIFFDYNAPIDTNLANTTFITLSNTVKDLDNSISIYPNPTSSKINIKSDFEIKTIELYDVQGRILETIIGNKNIIDISDKSNGIYFVKITSEKGSKVEKVIKN